MILRKEELPEWIGRDVDISIYPHERAKELLLEPGMQGFWETWGPVYGLERAYLELDLFSAR